MTYLEKLKADPSYLYGKLVNDFCPGEFLPGAPMNNPECPFIGGPLAGDNTACKQCWNQQVPGEPEDCHDQSEDWSRNDGKPEEPKGKAVCEFPSLKAVTITELLLILKELEEDWDSTKGAYQMELPNAPDPEKVENKIKACAKKVAVYQALSMELEKYREACGYGRCD